MNSKDLNKKSAKEKIVAKSNSKNSQISSKILTESNENIIPTSRSTHGKDLSNPANIIRQLKHLQDETKNLNSPKSTADGSMLSNTMDYSNNKKK